MHDAKLWGSKGLTARTGPIGLLKANTMYARLDEDCADSNASMATQLKSLMHGKLKKLLAQTSASSRRHQAVEIFTHALQKALVCCWSRLCNVS